MKTIKIIISILIVIIMPWIVYATFYINLPKDAIFAKILNFILCVFLIFIFGSYANSFQKWFNSKLK